MAFCDVDGDARPGRSVAELDEVIASMAFDPHDAPRVRGRARLRCDPGR